MSFEKPNVKYNREMRVAAENKKFPLVTIDYDSRHIGGHRWTFQGNLDSETFAEALKHIQEMKKIRDEDQNTHSRQSGADSPSSVGDQMGD